MSCHTSFVVSYRRSSSPPGVAIFGMPHNAWSAFQPSFNSKETFAPKQDIVQSCKSFKHLYSLDDPPARRVGMLTLAFVKVIAGGAAGGLQTEGDKPALAIFVYLQSTCKPVVDFICARVNDAPLQSFWRPNECFDFSTVP